MKDSRQVKSPIVQFEPFVHLPKDIAEPSCPGNVQALFPY